MSIEDVRSAFDDMMAGSATEAEVSEAIDKVQADWSAMRKACSALEGFFCDGVVAWSLLTKENMAEAADAMASVRRIGGPLMDDVCVYRPRGGLLAPACSDVWKAVPREEEG